MRLYNAKQAIKDFNKYHGDVKLAKYVINEIKHMIKYSPCLSDKTGRWFRELTKGTIEILQDNGYIVRKSATEADKYFVAFKECNVGLPLDD